MKKTKMSYSSKSPKSDDSEGDLLKKSTEEEYYDNKKILKSMFSKKELCYLLLIDKFFQKECRSYDIDRMIRIIEGKSLISLRILDWFVTTYSKDKIIITKDQDGDRYDIREKYIHQLKGFKKIYFDPFGRKTKFRYYYMSRKDKTIYIETTLCQLNFFKWAIKNKVVDYVEKNLEKIMKAMTDTNKRKKREPKDTRQNGDDKYESDSDSDNIELNFN